MVDLVRDNKVKAKRKENLLKKDELQTIEKNLKKMQIICLQLIAKVNKEAILEVVQELKIKISSLTKTSSNTCLKECLNSLMVLISIHLPKDNKIKTLDNMVFHLVIMVFKVSKLHKFISLLKSNSLSLKFHLINL
jgi:hypothetical protein